MSNSEHGDDGLRKGLTSYGDRDFSLFLRKAFICGVDTDFLRAAALTKRVSLGT